LVSASDFLRALIEAVPYKIHTVLIDNGIQFCHAPRNLSGPTARYSLHMFDRLCRENEIEHRLTKPNHPWTNGQVKRMNRTLKDATVKRYHYDSHEQLRTHLQLFLDAYNHARRLKTLRGLTPYEHVLQVWTKELRRLPTRCGPRLYRRRAARSKGARERTAARRARSRRDPPGHRGAKPRPSALVLNESSSSLGRADHQEHCNRERERQDFAQNLT
jgi:hypothetical protein